MSIRSASSRSSGISIDLPSLRRNARDIVSHARIAYLSPYEEWTSDELRTLLIRHKISIRDSANATHDLLVRICDEVFGEEIAESERDSIDSRQLSLEDIVVMEMAAKTIQKAYFRRKSMQRSHSSDYVYNKEYMDYEFDDLEVGDFSGFASLGQSLSSLASYESNNPNPTKYRHHSMIRKIIKEGDDYDEEIEVEWRKPSWKLAKLHERMVRPHRSGKKMPMYDWKSMTLGRHCFAGGCGEQLDLWNEGRTSEFSQFGSGITNYFKVSIGEFIHFIINSFQQITLH